MSGNIIAMNPLIGSQDENTKNSAGAKRSNGLQNGFGQYAGIYGTQNSEISATLGVELGSGRYDVNGYSEKNSSLTEIQRAADTIDVTSAQNFDVVMSHTLSQEDYAKARENGFDMKDVDADETVTILDNIKASLAESGTVIAGFNDDLNADELTRITGNRAYANEIVDSFKKNDIPLSDENIEAVQGAVNKGMELQEPEPSAVSYLIENKLDPTVDTLYLASYATNNRMGGQGTYYMQEGGYLAQLATTKDYSDLQNQIDDVIRKAGMDPEEDDVQQMAKELLTEGLPLTAENLERKNQIESLSFPLQRATIIAAAAAAIADGQDASKGNLANPVSELNKALQLSKDLLSQLDQSTVEKQNLTKQQIQNEVQQPNVNTSENSTQQLNVNTSEGGQTQQDLEKLQNRLKLEEIRYTISTETNLRLLQSGIEIDTSSMKNAMEQLESAVSQIAKSLFGETNATDTEFLDTETQKSLVAGKAMTAEEKYLLFRQTNARVTGIAEAPAAIIGALKDEFKSDVLDEIYTKGITLKNAYDKAQVSYETLGTSPRSDLGDSIQKAFRNVDAILEDMELDTSDENRRAVRILGYNHAALTQESIEEVKSWDSKLTSTIDRLKPAAVLSMIRDGQNPLSMTLEDLGGYLDEQEQKNGSQEEKYARFLYKLEQKKEISEEEKQSYIGVYRLFENLKKTDHAAIGTVLQTGSDMTIRNLLTANRTLKRSHKTMDYTIDDSFGGVTEGERKTQAIDDQIETAFRFYAGRADAAYENMEPGKMQAFEASGQNIPDAGLSEFADAMESLPSESQTEQEYNRMEVAAIRDVLSDGNASGNAQQLINAGIAVTVNNLEAVQALNKSRQSGRSEKSLWEELRSRIGIKAENAFDEAASLENYEDAIGDLSDTVEEQMQETDSYIDLQALSLFHKELSVASKMSEKGSFDVPVQVGEEIISMHVTMEESDEESASMKASIDSGTYGTIKADIVFHSDNEQTLISGILTTTNSRTPQAKSFMEKIKSVFSESLNFEMTDSDDNLPILYGARENTTSNSAGTRKEKGEAKKQGDEIQNKELKVSNQKLLKIAGTFAAAVTNTLAQEK